MRISHVAILVVAILPTFVLFADFRQLFAAFRKRHFDDFSYLFSEVLQIAQKMDILKLGTVRLSVDGAKFKANVSKLKNI